MLNETLNVHIQNHSVEGNSKKNELPTFICLLNTKT